METGTIWFKGLRVKLLALAVVPGILIGLGIYFTSIQMAELGKALQFSTLTRLPQVQLTGDMGFQVNGVSRWLWSAYASGQTANERAKTLSRAKDSIQKFTNAYQDYGRVQRSEKDKDIYRSIEDNIQAYDAGVKDVITLLQDDSPESINKAREVMIEQLRTPSRAIEKALSDLSALHTEEAEEEAKLSHAAYVRSERALLVGGGLGGLLVIIFGVVLGTQLAKSLTSIASQLAGASTEVRSAGGQIASTSHQVSSASTAAASALEETVSSLEELSSMVKLNAENSKQAAILSQSSSHTAEEGESEIKTLLQSMTEISASSRKIEDIINVIDDIAFQTNLLALNAAVEAARAGEQGKGFAVVAEAVRNLAQRSASAAKDITALIKDSVQKIEHGTRVADKSGGVLKNIVTSIKKVSDLNNEIAASSAEQSTGISQISKAMHGLDQSTQQNASASEELAASSEEMSSQAHLLQDLVLDLKGVIEGSRTTSQHHDRQEVRQPSGAHHHVASVTPIHREVHRESAGTKSAESVIPFDNDGHDKIGNIRGF